MTDIGDCLASLMYEVTTVQRSAREALVLLRLLKKHHAQPGLANDIIAELHRLRHDAERQDVGFALIARLNQTGQLRRQRADRLIALSDSTPLDRQAEQIDRDIDNLRWIDECAARLTTIIADAAAEVGV